MSEVARTLVRNRPVGEVLVQVVQLAFDTCPAERAFVVMKDQEAGTLVPRVARDRNGADIRAATISRTIVSRVMRIASQSWRATCGSNPHRPSDSVDATGARVHVRAACGTTSA